MNASWRYQYLRYLSRAYKAFQTAVTEGAQDAFFSTVRLDRFGPSVPASTLVTMIQGDGGGVGDGGGAAPGHEQVNEMTGNINNFNLN